MTYLVGPGEWICTLADLRTWFRCRFQHQAVSILEYLLKQNYITYSLLENKRVMNLITLVSFTGKHGSMIYLNDYLSVMFDISDVIIDKEEIAITVQLPIHVPENKEELCVSEVVKEEQVSVPENDPCVPKSHMQFIIQKVAEMQPIGLN